MVYIADEATAKYIAQVLTNLDRPKPQVLIKVVFLEVTLNDASDIGIEGSFNKSIGNSPGNGLVTNLDGGRHRHNECRHCPQQHNSRPKAFPFCPPLISSACLEPLRPSPAPTVSIKSSARIMR